MADKNLRAIVGTKKCPWSSTRKPASWVFLAPPEGLLKGDGREKVIRVILDPFYLNGLKFGSKASGDFRG